MSKTLRVFFFITPLAPEEPLTGKKPAVRVAGNYSTEQTLSVVPNPDSGL